MPVKNGEKFLKASVDSILKQSFQRFELIIVDDGSTDSTWEMMVKNAQEDDRIRISKAEGSGIVDALNQGLSRSKFDLIARMDADDISLPNRLELQYEYFNSNKSIDVVGANIEVFGWSPTDGWGSESSHTVQFPNSQKTIESSLKTVGGFWVLAHPVVMIRKNALVAAGGYSNRFDRAEDLDLWVRLHLKGAKFSNIERVLLKYREGQSSLSFDNRVPRYLATAVLINSVRDGSYPECDKELNIENLRYYCSEASLLRVILDFSILLRGVSQSTRLNNLTTLRTVYGYLFSGKQKFIKEYLNLETNWPVKMNASIKKITIEDILKTLNL